MAVNFLYVSVACTALSLLGLQWWLTSFLDRIKSDGILSGGALEVVLSSHVTIALLVNLALNVYFLIVIGLKVLNFFVCLINIFLSFPLRELACFLFSEGVDSELIQLDVCLYYMSKMLF